MVYSIQFPCNATCYDKCPKDVRKNSNAMIYKHSHLYQIRMISMKNYLLLVFKWNHVSRILEGILCSGVCFLSVFYVSMLIISWNKERLTKIFILTLCIRTVTSVGISSPFTYYICKYTGHLCLHLKS